MTADEPTPTPDLVTVLSATRTKLAELIDQQTAGVRPSPSEWLMLADLFSSAHLLCWRQHLLATKAETTEQSAC